jgi:hypothetical protein
MKIITKILLILLMLFCISNNVFTKQEKNKKQKTENIFSFLKLENQYIAEKDGIEPFDYMINFNEKSLYLIRKPTTSLHKGDKIVLYQISEKGHKKIYFIFPEDDWLVNFTIYKDKLFILGQYYIYLYNDIFGGNQIFNRKLKLSEMYSDIYFYNDKIITTKSCLSCEDAGVKALVYDLKTSTTKEHSFEKPIGFPLTYFQPKRNINFYKGYFLISDITKYRIRVYDLSFNQVSELSRSSIDWDKDSNQIFNKALENIKTIKDVRAKNDYIRTINDRYYVINLVDFLNENTIMVCWSTSLNIMNNGNGDKFDYYDIWQLNSQKKWELKEKNIEDSKNNPNDKFNFDNFNYLFSQYYVKEDKIIIPNFFPFDLRTLDLKNLTYKELYQKQSDYYKTNEIKSSFFIYKFIDK